MFVKQLLTGDARRAVPGQRRGGVAQDKVRAGETVAGIPNDIVDAGVGAKRQPVLVSGQLERLARGGHITRSNTAPAQPELQLRRVRAEGGGLLIKALRLGRFPSRFGCRALRDQVLLSLPVRLGQVIRGA